MGANDVMPSDAFDKYPECGWELIEHEVAGNGDVIHPNGVVICLPGCNPEFPM